MAEYVFTSKLNSISAVLTLFGAAYYHACGEGNKLFRVLKHLYDRASKKSPLKTPAHHACISPRFFHSLSLRTLGSEYSFCKILTFFAFKDAEGSLLPLPVSFEKNADHFHFKTRWVK